MGDRNSEPGFHFVGTAKQPEREVGPVSELDPDRAASPSRPAASEPLHKSGTLQRRARDSEQTTEVPGVVHDVLRGSGQPLDRESCELFEPRFSYDFTKVR